VPTENAKSIPYNNVPLVALTTRVKYLREIFAKFEIALRGHRGSWRKMMTEKNQVKNKKNIWYNKNF
jgi:hypothetical protein